MPRYARPADARSTLTLAGPTLTVASPTPSSRLHTNHSRSHRDESRSYRDKSRSHRDDGRSHGDGRATWPPCPRAGCTRRGALATALLLAPLAASAGELASSNSFALRAKAVWTAASDHGSAIERGVIVVRDGKIVAVGADLEPPDDLPLLELRDGHVCPGFVAAASGLVGPHTGPHSVSAAYRAIDSFDDYADQRELLSRGVTTAYVDPGGHRLVSGVGAVVKLAGPHGQRVLQPESDLAVNLGVFDTPPLIEPPFWASADVAIEAARRQRPSSRLGQFLELEQRAAAAADLLEQVSRGKAPFDGAALSFARVWKQGLPLRIQARRAVDIEGALEFVRKHKRPAYLVGATQADELTAALLESGLPVVVRIETRYRAPDSDLGPSPDEIEPALHTAARLARAVERGGPRAGLTLALAGREDDRTPDLALLASLAVRGGLSRELALAAITRMPAEILGVADRVGSLAPGRDADLLVLSGPPLATNSDVLRAYVGGRLVFEAPRGDALVVRAGTIWVGDGRTLQDASLLVEDGKVAAVGQRVPHPRFAQVIDAGPAGFVTPGFVDAHGHLGLEGDRTAPTPDLAIHEVIGVAGREFLRVARAGVTSVILAAYQTVAKGSRVAAIKTYGGGRGEMLTRELCAVKFALRDVDPLLGVEPIRKALEAGKKYDESWKKYEEELAKWRQGQTTEPPATQPAQEVKESQPDPITGTWEYSVSGGPMPRPLSGTLTLKLTGNQIEGRARGGVGASEERSVSGTLNGNEVALEIDTPAGAMRIKATLDREDHMKGEFTIAGRFTLDFEAHRTSKAPVEVKAQRRRRKGGQPEPPKVDENLEPLRPLLAGRIPALVYVRTAAEAAAALKLFVDEFKIPVVLLDAEEADQIADQLVSRREQVGVVVPPQVTRQRDRKPYLQADGLSRRGVRVGFQSDAEDGARNLPLMGLYAAREGLGGDAVLRALTIDAAKMYRLDDRIGSLEPGKDADLLIFRGHPFDAGSELERVIINGREVPGE